MSKVLTSMALFATLCSFSAPLALAEEDVISTETEMQADVNGPEADRRPPWHRGMYSCFAQNAFHQTFRVSGDRRAPREWVQRQAVRQCRQNTIFFLRQSCRPVGCR